MSQTMTPPAGPAAPPADPMAGAGPDSNVVCTITSNGDGTFTVYAGDEPEEGDGGDMSGDDVGAMGGAGDQSAGQPASSVGAALKLVMGILQEATSGGPGGAEDQFSSGFGGGGGTMPQKYPGQAA